VGEVEALAALARMTKSKASAKRNFEQRADDLFLAGVMESTKTAFLDAAEELPTGEVIFPRAEPEVASDEISSDLKPDELALPDVADPEPVMALASALAAREQPRARTSRRRMATSSAVAVSSVAIAALSLAAAIFFFARSRPAAPTTAVAANSAPVAAVPAAIVPAPAPASIETASPAQPEAPAPVIASAQERDSEQQAASSSSKREDEGREAAEAAVLAAAEAEVKAEAERAAAEAEILARAEAELAAKAEREAAAAQVVTASAPANKSISQLLEEGAGDLEMAAPAKDDKPSKKEVTREELKAQITKIRGRVVGCATQSGATGTAELRFTVEPSGRVVHGALAGGLGGSELEACARPLIESMRFEAFDGAPMSFTYPVPLKW